MSIVLIAKSSAVDYWPGATINAASASYSDVSAAVASASPGDKVVVPAGTASWSGNITISGIALIGPGKDAGSPTTVTAGKVIITKHATYKTMLRGFRFTANGRHVDTSGNSSNQMYFVGDCYFENAGASMILIGNNGGLWFSNEFVSPTPNNSDTFQMTLGNTSEADAAWDAGPYSGSDDTNGDKRTYYEDCTWDGFLEVAGDVDDGARATYRYCTFTDSCLTVHGGNQAVNGTSVYGGQSIEVHNCDFVRVTNSYPVNKWLWVRGGSGVFANNTLDKADSPDGFSYAGKPELRFSCGCGGTPSYPMAYQFGQTVSTPENPPSKPFLVFGNTGAGASDSNFISVDGDPGGLTCSTEGNYIQASRDYYTSNNWSWTAFTYPHPMRAGAEAA